MAIVRVTAYGNIFGQECLNVFHYRAATGVITTVDLDELCQGVAVAVLEKVAAMQSAEYAWDKIKAEEVDTGVAVFEAPLAIEGEVPYPDVDSAPPFVAYKFQLNRASANTRHGWKRFAGVPETILTTSNVPGVAALAGIIAIQNGLQATINTITNDLVFEPIIARYSAETGEITAFTFFQSVSFRGFTTQNTRKR